MKAHAVPIALALLGAGAALGAMALHPSASTASTSAPAQKPASKELPSVAPQGRVFLTAAQQREALTSGTIDRPIKSLLVVNAPLRFGDFAWNDTAVPAGPTFIRIDLRTQLISVFRGGHEIGTAVIVYGGDNKETPVGTQHILAKSRDHRSSLYDADMPYALRLTEDGVAIHASDVRWGAATHGCIGVPMPFAERLFDAMKVGDEVVIIPAVGANSPRMS